MQTRRAHLKSLAALAGAPPDETDATAALQAIVDSGARRVVVPYRGYPWVVRPITLRGNQEIVFEPGVVILAKPGEFSGRNDSLFTAARVSDLTIRGYGATFRMRKAEYQRPPYEKAEWRMGLALHDSRRVTVEGLRIESTGGDGIYVDGGEQVTIRDCTCFDNHRQGVSVISAANLLIENCTFSGTSGTAPEAGIDLEPNTPGEQLVNCVVRNCVFENNRGHGMLVYLKPLTAKSAPVSIRFENCLVRGGGATGMAVGAVRDDGPGGLIEFVDCTVEGPAKEGARIYDKSARAALVRFIGCKWKDPGGVPVLVELRTPDAVRDWGGITFENCRAFDKLGREPLKIDDRGSGAAPRDIRGRIAR